jgi:cyclic pyranopterin monophosphate synthase
MSKLSHVDQCGKANMVDVGDKVVSVRTARASCKVIISEEVFDAIQNNTNKKGDVLTVAKIAGIQAAKKTSELIPLCHNIFISKIDVELKLEEKSVLVESFARTESKTGIEMEALTACSVAALTIYDMCKAIDKTMQITDLKLIEKTGGKSGDFKFEPKENQ